MRVRTFFLFVSPLLVGASVFALTRVLPRFGREHAYWDDGVADQVRDIVATQYVDPLGDRRSRELFDAAMRGYVGELDSFSRFVTAEERRDLDEDTSGSFAGVGVQVRVVAAGLLVTGIYEDGPADVAGLLPGDVVTRVDDTEVAGLGLTETIDRVKGPEGTTVVLWTVRDDHPPQPIEVRRALVDLDTVPAVRLVPGATALAYVRISQFSDTTPKEVAERLGRLVETEGAQGIVLDLRGNLGGLVTAAVRVASLFLPPESVVCVTRGRRSARPHTVPAEASERLREAPFTQPLVVLVDEDSASASEILAGALQDHGRAVLVGERTYGKFLVQSLAELEGTDALLKLTTSRYETPRGRSGQRDDARRIRGGILPDVRVPLEDTQRAAVFLAFSQQAGPRWKVMEGREGDAGDADRQLRTAVDLLRGVDPPAEPLPPRRRTERG